MKKGWVCDAKWGVCGSGREHGMEGDVILGVDLAGWGWRMRNGYGIGEGRRMGGVKGGRFGNSSFFLGVGIGHTYTPHTHNTSTIRI